MPRFNVEHEGKWIVFSSGVDDFITSFMTVEEFVKWRDTEYGVTNTKNCLAGKGWFARQSLEWSLIRVGMTHGIDRVKEIIEDEKLNIDIQKIEGKVGDG
jgi:hypothetical protein